MEYKIDKINKPPIYDECVEKFNVSLEGGTIFTYGDTIFTHFDLHPCKLAHELVHVRQQGKNPKKWWKKYFKDKKFRFEQELEAYTTETRFLKEHYKDRNFIARIVMTNARDLSSEMYGNIISYEEAYKLLK